jgi:hypothetical protein
MLLRSVRARIRKPDSAFVRRRSLPRRDGDAPSGFHPNVSVPGHRISYISFLRAMAAHREVEDRRFGVVNFERGLEQGGSGLEAARKK